MNRQQQGDSTNYGPYSQSYGYDQWGNMTTRVGWGGSDGGYVNWTPSYTNNRLNTNPAAGAAMQYDLSGSLTNDSYQVFSYDATGQQAYASGSPVSQSYDGGGLRVKKLDAGITTWYLRSSVLSGQVICELNVSGSWARGYVYLGGQMVAIQSSGVNWVHQDPVTKSQRVTNSSGTVTSTVDLDPWGGETSTSSNQAFQPHRYTTYERDANGSDDAKMRRYHGYWNHFDQPDPYDGSFNFTDPQSFNRYPYTQNDPVNFTDPTGLFLCLVCPPDDSGGFLDPPGFWDLFDASNGGPDGFGPGGFPGDPGRGGGGHETGHTNQQNTFAGTSSQWWSQNWIKCPPVQFKITGIGPNQAPGTTAISQTARADIPDGGVAIKPANFGVKGINGNNRSVFLNMRFSVDWTTATPAGAPAGIPTQGPFSPVDNIGPASVRNSPGNMIDVYNYQSSADALASTRTVMVTTWIPENSAGVTCPK
jgi:RHS repeat-associated protein